MRTVVYGLGISAIAVLKKIRSFSDEVYVVNKGHVDHWKDQVHSISTNFKCLAEEDSLDILSSCDRVILSPGIPRYIKWLKHTDPSKIISEIEFAFLYSDVPVIAVTGSNGKTTTTTMIYESLKLFGKKVFIGGNIGIPYSDIIGEDFDYAVIEVSSFQLESIQSFKPIVSIITNLTPNHMERYKDFDEYKKAKYRIYKNQDMGLHLAQNNNTKVSSVHFKQIKKIESFSFQKTHVIGEHNLYNFFCANEVCKFLCDNYSSDTFQLFIDSFKSPKYRLEFIKQVNNFKFYNDSKSTNLESTIKAIESFDDEVILILGGKLRTDNVDEFKVLNTYRFKKIFVYGEAKEQLSSILDTDVCDNINSVFLKLSLIQSGNVLFSPGFPSFDLYKNFEQRGDHFNKLVASFKA